MLERLREAVVPPRKEKVVVIRSPAVVIILASPICSTATAAGQYQITSLRFI